MTYEFNSHTLYIGDDTKIQTIIHVHVGNVVYESTNMNNEPTTVHVMYNNKRISNLGIMQSIYKLNSNLDIVHKNDCE